MKVLISPGYGAGWSTWEHPEMAFDKVLIEAFERGITASEMQDLCVERGYGEVYMGGFKNLKVVEVPNGACFQIKEYDGHEYIDYFYKDDWYIAQGEYL